LCCNCKIEDRKTKGGAGNKKCTAKFGGRDCNETFSMESIEKGRKMFEKQYNFTNIPSNIPDTNFY